MEFDIGRLAILGLALAAGAIVKGATGMGLPLIALPVITAAFGLQHAVGLMTVPLILTNLQQVVRFRAAAGGERMRFLPAFLVAGAVGIVIGTWALTSLPERTLVFSLGLILIAYVVLRLATPHFALSPAAARRYGPIAGTGAGILQGATGISAPIGVTFIHSMGFERDGHVFAVSAMFLVFAVTQLPALVVAGVMQPHWLLDGVLALIPILIFMPVGQWLAGRMSRKAFDWLILAFLGLIGLKMVLGL
jgi:uncharacterized membrane protein YfcA